MSGTPDRPVARQDVVFRTLAREWVIYDPGTHNLHVLNVTAALVWSLCDGGHGLDDMVQEVLDTLQSVPGEESVREDVRAALERFGSEGLLA